MLFFSKRFEFAYEAFCQTTKRICVPSDKTQNCILCPDKVSSLILNLECDNMEKHLWSLTLSTACRKLQWHCPKQFLILFCTLFLNHFEVKKVSPLILTQIKPMLYHNR